jgi:hypothetical protein
MAATIVEYNFGRNCFVKQRTGEKIYIDIYPTIDLTIKTHLFILVLYRRFACKKPHESPCGFYLL